MVNIQSEHDKLRYSLRVTISMCGYKQHDQVHTFDHVICATLVSHWLVEEIKHSDWLKQSTQPCLQVTLATPVPGYTAQLNIDNRPASLNMLELSLTQYHVSAPCACQSFIEKKNILLIFCCVGNSLVCLIIFVQSAQ